MKNEKNPRRAPKGDSPDPVQAVGDAMLTLQRLTSNRTVHQMLMQMVGSDLSIQETRVLLALHSESLTATEVARRLRMDAGASSRQVTSLTERGLVKRTTIRDTDGPSTRTLLTVSARGRTLAGRIESVRASHLNRTFANWSPDDATALARLLTQFVADMQSTPYSPSSVTTRKAG